MNRREPVHSAPTPLRLVVLTIGGRYGVLILRALAARSLVPTAVVVEARTALRDCFHARTLAGQIRELPLVPLRALWRHLRPRVRSDLRIGAPVVVTGSLNSEAMQRDLERLRPDLLILAGIGIVSPEILAIPRLGTVNVHLALLPWVRGNDVVAHSILEGIPIGATCHLVDRGIDTGPVLGRRLLDVRPVPPSLAALEAESITLGVALMVDSVTSIAASGVAPQGVAQTERRPLHRFLPAEVRADADTLIRAGAARRLFERWLPLAKPGTMDLPSTLDMPAPPRDPDA